MPHVLYKFPEYAGKPFQPSNGTEGIMFCEAFCDRCAMQHPNSDDPEKQCLILLSTMIHSPGDKEYPFEWKYNAEGWPVCTSWIKWDWGNGDDPDGWNEPPGPEPYDPNQLLIPFDITELFEFSDDLIVTRHCVTEASLWATTNHTDK